MNKEAANEAGRMIARGFFFAIGAFAFRRLIDFLSQDEDDNLVLVVQEADRED